MPARDYRRVEAAIAYLRLNVDRQPSLGDVAAHVGLSPFHFERLFRRWAGTTPKRFLQAVTLARAKEALAASRSVLDAAYDAGLSGPGRLHDLFVTVEAVTPGEFKQRGEGLTIRYGVHETPLGPALVGLTARGLCALSFVDEGEEAAAVAALAAAWPEAALVEDPAATRPVVDAAFAEGERHAPLRVLLRGTNFQLQVWQALLRIPPGRVLAYDDVAALLGRPTAARAVGRAVGQNPVAVLIPCHRVLRKDGALGGYRWGLDRKRALLAREAIAPLREAA
jgi:AraC family transcriptional regulator of adaptative response/methylated-DNA-[protein]-cysteine methyltransferase